MHHDKVAQTVTKRLSVAEPNLKPILATAGNLWGRSLVESLVEPPYEPDRKHYSKINCATANWRLGSLSG